MSELIKTIIKNKNDFIEDTMVIFTEFDCPTLKDIMNKISYLTTIFDNDKKFSPLVFDEIFPCYLEKNYSLKFDINKHYALIFRNIRSSKVFYIIKNQYIYKKDIPITIKDRIYEALEWYEKLYKDDGDIVNEIIKRNLLHAQS